MYEIKKNIPIPVIERHAGRPAIYPFAEMAIGDSILIPVDKNSKRGLSARRSAHGYADRHSGFKFTTLFVDSGLRIWRVSTDG